MLTRRLPGIGWATGAGAGAGATSGAAARRGRPVVARRRKSKPDNIPDTNKGRFSRPSRVSRGKEDPSRQAFVVWHPGRRFNYLDTREFSRFELIYINGVKRCTLDNSSGVQVYECCRYGGGHPLDKGHQLPRAVPSSKENSG